MTRVGTAVKRLIRRVRAWWVLLTHGGKTAQLLAQRPPEASELNDSGTAGPEGHERNEGSAPTGSAFELGRSVGRPGGQGAVFEVARNPDLVYKQYHAPFVGAATSFISLMECADRVDRDLPPEVTMTWPIHLFGTGNDVSGYTMKRVPDDYFVTIARPDGTTVRQLGLDQAVPRESKFRPTRATTPQDRLGLARLIGIGLDALHRHDVLYRDMSWANFAYALDPPRIMFMDMDSARPITTPIIKSKDGVDTPDWIDHDNPASEPLGFDLDRYKYALLVHRLLASHELLGSLPASADLVTKTLLLDGVHPRHGNEVVDLYRRVLAGPGQRPPISEWLDKLAG